LWLAVNRDAEKEAASAGLKAARPWSVCVTTVHPLLFALRRANTI
jgi:hypothetical protein